MKYCQHSSVLAKMSTETSDRGGWLNTLVLHKYNWIEILKSSRALDLNRRCPTCQSINCMSVKTPVLFHLIFFILIKLINPDLIESKAWRACDEDQAKLCHPGRCKPAPREYPESYTCECTRNNYLERTFDTSRIPRLIARCSALSFNPCMKCHEKHTIKCTYVKNTANVSTGNVSAVCQCYSEYSESSNCFKKKDPCEEVPLGASFSGNLACKVEFGNLCIPQLGTQKYVCICLKPYRASKSLRFSNCMGEPESACDRQLCVGFQPLRTKNMMITARRVIATKGPGSSDGEQAWCYGNGTCVCPTDWYGEHCTQWYASPQDGSWTVWTNCKPNCLDRAVLSSLMSVTGIGYRISKSLCAAKDPRFCGGKMKMWSRCKVTTLCSSENEAEEKFSPEVAKVAADVVKNYYDKVRKMPLISFGWITGSVINLHF